MRTGKGENATSGSGEGRGISWWIKSMKLFHFYLFLHCWHAHLFPQTWSLMAQVGEGGALGRSPAMAYPHILPTPSFPLVSVMEVIRQIFYLQGTVHLLPRPCGYRWKSEGSCAFTWLSNMLSFNLT